MLGAEPGWVRAPTGTSYELGTVFMGEGTEFLGCAPQNSGASLTERANLCVCGVSGEMQRSLSLLLRYIQVPSQPH